MPASLQTIHLVFKTHLDIGFTGFARDVKEENFSSFIPAAMDLAASLRRAGGEERFVWTTGSWLIYEYLEQASSRDRRRMEEAIAAGDIAWHALPLTAHSELMDASLFQYGLSLSRELDARFGRKTIAGKMTDVPGHTRAIVPLLAEAGIRLLHIGVNPASMPPDVPQAFTWRSPDGSEVVVVYQKGDYGGLTVVPGVPAALSVFHTLDNVGPPRREHVEDAYRELRRRYPDASIAASTLNDFAAGLLAARPELPVVTGELGDTWIHGAGTDPAKIRRFRELCRMRSGWLEDGSADAISDGFAAFSRSLLLVPEHTWGLDVKEHVGDDHSFGAAEFAQARETPGFRRLEASWREQRDYLDTALAALGDSEMAATARSRLAGAEPRLPATEGFRRIEVGNPIETAHFMVQFDPADGAITGLSDRLSGRDWAGADRPLGRFMYEVFSQQDYDRYLDQYQYPEERWDWYVRDFSKPGMADAVEAHDTWRPMLIGAWRRDCDRGTHIVLEMGMAAEPTACFGAPARLFLEVDFPVDERVVRLDFQYFEKRANRLPEAMWLSFCPDVSGPDGWMLDKMGEPVSPLEVVRNGNRKLHAVSAGVRHSDRRGRFAIDSPDAPLVAPGEPSLLDFNDRQPPLEQGMHFNLYNNVWGTNFPMWSDEDARFRFVLRPESYTP